MQVTQANARLVAALFAALSVDRFKMRTIGAITKDTDFTEEQVKDVAAQIGFPLRHRIADAVPLIERADACSPTQAAEIAAKAKALDESGGEPFEVSYLVAAEHAADAPAEDDEDTNM